MNCHPETCTYPLCNCRSKTDSTDAYATDKQQAAGYCFVCGKETMGLPGEWRCSAHPKQQAAPCDVCGGVEQHRLACPVKAGRDAAEQAFGKQQAATPRTDEIAAVMRSMSSTSGETYFALRDAAIAGIEALETELTERTEQLSEANRKLTDVAGGEPYTKFAYQEVHEFYEKWPGGLDEIESSQKQFRERIAASQAEVARLKDLVGRCRSAVLVAVQYEQTKPECDFGHAALLTEIEAAKLVGL